MLDIKTNVLDIISQTVMHVKQISNLFALMDYFVRARKPLSVREIVSAFNIVETMVECGYLYQPVARGGYYPTTRWMELARDLSESQPLPESVHRLLVELMNQTGETLSLAAAGRSPTLGRHQHEVR